MAATVLREAYDCVVLGSGPTARLLANRLTAAGRRSLLLQREPVQGLLPWLHPRCTSHLESNELKPQLLANVAAVDATGKALATLSASDDSRLSAVKSSEQLAIYSVPAECEIHPGPNGGIELRGPDVQHWLRPQLIFAVEGPAASLAGTAIGGIYQNAKASGVDGRQATLFTTRRQNEVCWLVPLANGAASVGLWQNGEQEQSGDSLAAVFEEALVACPLLTQQLIAAELVGSLDSIAATPPTPPVAHPSWISLPEYDAWFDPVFASGWWLAEEMIRQIVTQLGVAGECANQVHQRVVIWRSTWQAVEQLTRERIAPWYRLDDTLPAALRDLAQRSWYERLLGADSSRASLPETAALWSGESRSLFKPRRAISL